MTLLLFSIGLKLDIRTLLAKEIWGGATLHNVLTTGLFTLALLVLKQLGIGMMADLDISSWLNGLCPVLLQYRVCH